MIRLTQTEVAHDKKQQDSSSPDESTTTIKKEANVRPGTSQWASSCNFVAINLSLISILLFL